MPRKPFLTPEFTSGGTACRTLRMPNNKEWLGVFNSALLELLNPYNWEQVNGADLTIDEAIAICDAILNEYWLPENCTDGDFCLLPSGNRIIRLSADGHYEQMVGGAWSETTDDYAVPPVPEREEATPVERECLAAANAANVLALAYEAISDAVAAEVSAQEAAVAFVAAMVALVGTWIALPLTAIIETLLGLWVVILEIAEFMTADLWDAEFTEIVICQLLDCASSDGDVVTFDLECFNDGLAARIDLLDADAYNQIRLAGQIAYMLMLIGADGMNAAGATTGITAYDCNACNPCENYEDFFETGLGALTSLVAGWGSWDAGNGHLAGGCIVSTVGTGFRDAGVEVDFGFECTVTQVSGWGRSSLNAGAWAMYVYYLDDTHTEIHNEATSLVTVNRSTWQLKSVLHEVSGVRYVRILLETNGGNRAYLDEIQITVD